MWPTTMQLGKLHIWRGLNAEGEEAAQTVSDWEAYNVMSVRKASLSASGEPEAESGQVDDDGEDHDEFDLGDVW